jgi:hypothetical protein
MKSFSLLTVVVNLWARTLSPAEFKIVTYLYAIADSTPDRKVSQSIQEIAEATGLSWRTVQDKLQGLDTRGVIKVLSADKQRTLIQMPPEHWPSPELVVEQPVDNPKPVVEPPASIPELIFRLTGQRPSAQELASMKTVSGNNEQRLRHCLDSLLLRHSVDSPWATVDLLAVAVEHELRGS